MLERMERKSDPVTVAAALREGRQQLLAAHITSAFWDADVLLAFALRWSKERLFAYPDAAVPPRALRRFRQLLQRRCAQEPVAYITGKKEFYGRAFAVNRHVLIPRPESELLIQTILELFERSAPLRIADIGTGSGCLAVTLAAVLPRARIIATDVSRQALAVAQKNARAHGVASRITFRTGDLLDPVGRHRLGILIANLPYVTKAELRTSLDLAFEPVLALRGREAPQQTYQRFLAQWQMRRNRPIVVLEIHPNLRPMLKRECKRLHASVTFRRDLAGRDRVAILRKHGHAEHNPTRRTQPRCLRG